MCTIGTLSDDLLLRTFSDVRDWAIMSTVSKRWQRLAKHARCHMLTFGTPWYERVVHQLSFAEGLMQWLRKNLHCLFLITKLAVHMEDVTEFMGLLLMMPLQRLTMPYAYKGMRWHMLPDSITHLDVALVEEIQGKFSFGGTFGRLCLLEHVELLVADRRYEHLHDVIIVLDETCRSLTRLRYLHSDGYSYSVIGEQTVFPAIQTFWH